MRLANPARNIFNVPHLRAGLRMTSLIVHDVPGALQLCWPSDSRPLNLDRLPPDQRRLSHAEWTAHLDRHFPFLADTDFETLRGGGTADAPPTGSSM